jgi:hypothetical protein
MVLVAQKQIKLSAATTLPQHKAAAYTRPFQSAADIVLLQRNAKSSRIKKGGSFRTFCNRGNEKLSLLQNRVQIRL